MKIFSSLFCIAVFMGFIGGCTPSKKIAAVPAAEQLRILSTVTAADHIIAELGCAEKIICIDKHGKILPSMEKALVAVAGNSVSREVLLKQRINCAVVWYYQRDLIALLEREKINTVVIEPITLEKYPDTVRQLGVLCGRHEHAEAMVKRFQMQTAAMKQAEKAKNVYFELYAPWKTPGKTGYISSIMQRAGGSLIAPENGGTVSPEAVTMAKVEAIFYVENFAAASEIASRTALRNAPAVKNKRIYAVPRYLVSEGVAPEELLKFFYEKIKDI